MARRLYEPLSCWPYRNGRMPVLPLTVTSLEGNMVVREEPVPLDTGFHGSVLLSTEQFRGLERAELPESESRVYRTLIGTIPMRTARAIVELPNCDPIETLVDTPRYGRGMLLIGLQTVRTTHLLLSGPNLETCVVKPRKRIKA